MENNYQYLIRKLDDFIRRFYKNQLMKGFIYFFTFSLSFYLAVIIPEYYAYFSTTVRTILFFSFILINASILFYWVFTPLFKIYNIGKIISHKQAADIIGKHFPTVQDKLLNTLQLKELSDSGPFNRELIEASINKRIVELKPVPFSLAIDFSKNKKYLKYALIPAAAFLFILFTAPSILTKSTDRFIRYSEYFEKEAPFRFVITNETLKAIKQEDFLLKIKVQGDEIPDGAYINIGNNQYKLKKESNVEFSYLFKNLQSDVTFSLTDGQFESKSYILNVLPNPTIINFSISLKYPAYLNKTNEVVHNAGDIVVPEGTFVQWNFFTKDAEELHITFNDSAVKLNKDENNRFVFDRYFFRNNLYTVIPANRFVRNKDSVSYSATVVPDMFPEIKTEEFKDSLFENRLYFKGSIKDDYGFKALNFVYRLVGTQGDTGTVGQPITENISIFPGTTEQQFFHFWDVTKLNFVSGASIEYYFEVWDNDGVNGSKSSKSQKHFIKLETQKEKDEKQANANKEIKEKLEESIKLAKEIQRDLKDVNLKMLEKKDMGWEEKKKIENILDKNNQLQQNIQQINKENEKKNLNSTQPVEKNEALQEKQQQLQEMFEKLMTDEMKKLFEELQKLMENADKNKTQEMLEKMNLSSKDLEKELDRNLELFKQLELEQKFDNIINKLDDLKEKQEKLSEQTLDKKSNIDDLKNKQENLNQEFKDLRKEMNDLNKMNQELEKPNNIQNTDPQENEIQQEQQNSSEQLQQKKNDKAGKSQKNASQKMEQLSNDLKKMKKEMEDQAYEEDLDNLRSILENLIKISFDEEELITELKKVRTENPKYISLIQKQKKILDDSKVVEDSLLALSKRNVEIESVVNKEVTAMKNNMERAVKSLEQRNTGETQIRQQTAMTSVNNLALILSESFENMQDQKMQSNQQCKGGKCKKKGKKAGGSKMSMATMKKMQEELNKQIQQLKDGLKDPSKLGNRGKQTISEQLAKMAAQQEALRNELQKYSQSMKNDPNAKTGDMEKIAKEMERTETDLVNKLITNETLKRQQEILTRLLEHEKAEREREQEEKRESKEVKDDFFRNHFQKNQYNINRLKGEELIKTVPPSFNPYYKKKVNEYFNNFDEKILQ